MPSIFLTSGIWPRLTKLAKARKGHVAVAYCSTGARRQLPLLPGSVLVVDASENAVKSGQTDPTELAKFVRAGVEVHSAAGLHAKVFVFGRAAVVGSTNASRRSARHLQEAALISSERHVVRQARDFVLDQTGERLTISHLERLAGIYRPPKFVPTMQDRNPLPRRRLPGQAPLWLVPVVYGSWDEQAYEQAAKARPEALARLRTGERLDELQYRGAGVHRLHRGEQVMQVVSDGDRVFVYPAGHIVKMQRYVGARRAPIAIVFVALPDGVRARRLEVAKKALGNDRNILARLDDLRLVRDRATAHALRQIWRPR